MKKLIYISIFIIIGATLFNKSYAQKTNPAIIENVPESYVWEIIYKSFKEHNKILYSYYKYKQTQTAKSGFYRYTSMMVDNRAKYQVTYKNGNIEIKFVDRQYLSKNVWVNNLLPLSKKTKKKYIYPIAETIRELVKEKNKYEEIAKKIEKTKNENKEILGEVKGGKILMEKFDYKSDEKMLIGAEYKFRRNPVYGDAINEIYIGFLPKDTPLDFLFENAFENKKYVVTKNELETYKKDSLFTSKTFFQFKAPQSSTNVTTGEQAEIDYYDVIMFSIDPSGKKIIEIDRKAIIVTKKESKGFIKIYDYNKPYKPGEKIIVGYHENGPPIGDEDINMWVGLLEKNIKPKSTPSKSDFISTKNITKRQNERLHFKAPNEPGWYKFLLYSVEVPEAIGEVKFEVIIEKYFPSPVLTELKPFIETTEKKYNKADGVATVIIKYSKFLTKKNKKISVFKINTDKSSTFYDDYTVLNNEGEVTFDIPFNGEYEAKVLYDNELKNKVQFSVVGDNVASNSKFSNFMCIDILFAGAMNAKSYYPNKEPEPSSTMILSFRIALECCTDSRISPYGTRKPLEIEWSGNTFYATATRKSGVNTVIYFINGKISNDGNTLEYIKIKSVSTNTDYFTDVVLKKETKEVILENIPFNKSQNRFTIYNSPECLKDIKSLNRTIDYKKPENNYTTKYVEKDGYKMAREGSFIFHLNFFKSK